MKYNFETCQDRCNAGSFKYELMKSLNPNVSQGVMPFSTADMEFNVAPEIIEGLKEYIDDSILGYQMPTDVYKESVVCWFKKRYGVDIEKEWINPSPGVISGYYAGIKTVTDPGDGVIVMPPVYGHFFDDVENQDRVLVECDLLVEDMKHKIDFEKLETLAEDKNNKALLFCNPHNPGGRVWTEEELKKLTDICFKNDLYIVCDEIHADFIRPGYKFTSLLNISDDVRKRLIVSHAPNKTFNIAGLKAGNTIIPNEEIREKFKEVAINSHLFGTNSMALKATELAYTKCEDWLDELLQVIDENIKYLTEFIEKEIPEIKVYDTEGTYLVYMDMSGLGMGENLEDFLHNEAELFLNLGSFFHEKRPGHVRVNVACPKDKLEEGLNRLLISIKNK